MGYLQGEAFRTHADGFLRQSMRKGVPSLFSSLRPIYKMALRNNIDVSESIQKQAMERVQILGELVEGYVKSLDATSELPALEGDSVKEKESPTMLLWALFFLAQHYDMMSESVSHLSIYAGTEVPATVGVMVGWGVLGCCVFCFLSHCLLSFLSAGGKNYSQTCTEIL